MPELPEVESTRRTLAARIWGAKVGPVWLGKPLRWPLGCPPGQLAGTRVGAVQRRGKYLWLPLHAARETLHEDAAPRGPDAAGGAAGQAPDGGLRAGAAGGLLMHLGMSGSLLFDDPAALPPRGAHDHFEMHTSRGLLRLHDPRRFGAVIWSPDPGHGRVATLLAGLGPEPFDPALDGAALHAAWRARQVAVKQALLAGDAVVGAGNIYACEALFAAGIDPRLPAGRLSRPRAERLLEAVRNVLNNALRAGGTSLRDYRNALGEPGGFQFEARVYGREGQPCLACGHPVRRIVQGQRSTFFCPMCQRR